MLALAAQQAKELLLSGRLLGRKRNGSATDLNSGSTSRPPSVGASPPSSPFVEVTSAMLTDDLPFFDLDAFSTQTTVPRSMVTDAVFGHECTSLCTLPPEMILLIFAHLDAQSLCRLACVSKFCTHLANDDAVWARSAVGHGKDVERMRRFFAAQVRQERLEAEARWRRQQWRRWKRRVIGVLQALCGATLVMLVVMSVRRARSASLTSQPAASVDTIAAKGAEQTLKYDAIVWDAVASSIPTSCSSIPRSHRS